MNEMEKSHPARLRAGDYTWLKGNILDVGAGPWPLKLDPPSIVRAWDLEDGDAQLLDGVPDNSYDVVFGSHVMEHVRDPDEALRNWSRVLKEGGHAMVVVPSYMFYEKLHDFTHGTENESRFNGDHKTSWDLLNIDRPKNHRHYAFKDMVRLGIQAGLTLTDLRLELDGFQWDKWRDPKHDCTRHGGLAQWCMIFSKF